MIGKVHAAHPEVEMYYTEGSTDYNDPHVAVENPSGEKVLILTNLGPARTIQVNQGLSSAAVPLEENSIATLTWK